MSDHDDIARIALDWAREGRGVALATVLATWGSAPRRPGAMLVVDQDMTFLGSVSGGCVEGAVITEALDAMKDGRPRVLTFGVSDDTAFATGLACGGEISVMVEPVNKGQGIPLDQLAVIAEARAMRRPILLRTDTRDWSRQIVQGNDANPEQARQLLTDRAVFEDGVFTAPLNAALRLAIVGAVHIAQPLASMAKLAGYDVTVIDPRDSFASASRFPDQRLVSDWPDDALRDWRPDGRSAVVTLSHDPKIDTPALILAAKSDAFYIGALGSVRTHAKRVAELKAARLTEDQIARIDAPVGLDIGSATPPEIAVSIMAAIIQALRRPKERR